MDLNDQQEPTTPDEVPDAIAKGDALFILGVITDNDHWNSNGITEDDISVVFEMSDRCRWGETFSVRRFQRALKLLDAPPRVVVKRGARWFTYANERVESFDASGARVCARSGCARDISHLRTDARYCSPGCQNRAKRASQRSK